MSYTDGFIDGIGIGMAITWVLIGMVFYKEIIEEIKGK